MFLQLVLRWIVLKLLCVSYIMPTWQQCHLTILGSTWYRRGWWPNPASHHGSWRHWPLLLAALTTSVSLQALLESSNKLEGAFVKQGGVWVTRRHEYWDLYP